MASPDDSAPRLEIERKYLLRVAPVLPPSAETWRIEQGYLPGQGRLRRITRADGRVVLIHTLKQGVGLVRQEVEREITPEAFERDWPATQGARLRKTRHRVPDAATGLVWEIDVFDQPPGLVLAEVELPEARHPSSPPAWLAPFIEREVTDDPRYTNRAIAAALTVQPLLRHDLLQPTSGKDQESSRAIDHSDNE